MRMKIEDWTGLLDVFIPFRLGGQVVQVCLFVHSLPRLAVIITELCLLLGAVVST